MRDLIRDIISQVVYVCDIGKISQISKKGGMENFLHDFTIYAEGGLTRI